MSNQIGHFYARAVGWPKPLEFETENVCFIYKKATRWSKVKWTLKELAKAYAAPWKELYYGRINNRRRRIQDTSDGRPHLYKREARGYNWWTRGQRRTDTGSAGSNREQSDWDLDTLDRAR